MAYSNKNNNKSNNSNNKSKNSNSKNNSKSKSNSNSKNKNNRNNKKDNFDDTTKTFEDIIDTISVSPSASDQEAITWKEQFADYIILFMKYAFLVGLFTLNFLGLSVSLNCNADQELGQRVISALFAFFFGFVYLIINYYTYKVLGQGKICKMDRDKLFPFKT